MLCCPDGYFRKMNVDVTSSRYYTGEAYLTRPRNFEAFLDAVASAVSVELTSRPGMFSLSRTLGWIDKMSGGYTELTETAGTALNNKRLVLSSVSLGALAGIMYMRWSGGNTNK